MRGGKLFRRAQHETGGVRAVDKDFVAGLEQLDKSLDVFRPEAAADGESRQGRVGQDDLDWIAAVKLRGDLGERRGGEHEQKAPAK